MIHVRNLTRHGRSLVLTIPPDVREALQLARGDQVILAVNRGRLIVAKYTTKRYMETLQDLEAGDPS